MPKLTKTNLTKMLNNTTSGLEKDVITYVLDKWNDYSTNKNAIFTDVLNYGCQSGSVGHLIYYADTIAYYDTHKDEINSLLHRWLWEIGTNNHKDLFGDKWDDEDPLALDTHNKNLLAWFGFEETMRDIGNKFDDLRDHI